MGAGTLAGCAGKQGFVTWRHAARAAERIARRQPNHPVNVYKCGGCGFFHVGRVAEDRRDQARDWKRKKRAMKETEE